MTEIEQARAAVVLLRGRPVIHVEPDQHPGAGGAFFCSGCNRAVEWKEMRVGGGRSY